MSAVAEPFATVEQQRRAAVFGMSLFLATEILLFGGLFAAILHARYAHPAGFVAASRELHLWIGAANTAVLLASSFAAALAVVFAKAGNDRGTVRCLLVTVALGAGFLALKALEYTLEYRDGLLPVPGGGAALSDPVLRLFMDFYLVATSLHALHMLVGVGLLVTVAVRVHFRRIALPERAIAVEVPILYWHLVDVVWVFLYPALYLAR